MVKIRFNSIYKNWGKFFDPNSDFKIIEIIKEKPTKPIKFSELDKVIDEPKKEQLKFSELDKVIEDGEKERKNRAHKNTWRGLGRTKHDI